MVYGTGPENRPAKAVGGSNPPPSANDFGDASRHVQNHLLRMRGGIRTAERCHADNWEAGPRAGG